MSWEIRHLFMQVHLSYKSLDTWIFHCSWNSAWAFKVILKHSYVPTTLYRIMKSLSKVIYCPPCLSRVTGRSKGLMIAHTTNASLTNFLEHQRSEHDQSYQRWCCEGGEALIQVAEKSCGCPIPVSLQRLGWRGLWECWSSERCPWPQQKDWSYKFPWHDL